METTENINRKSFVERMEFNRFGVISFTLTVQSCLGALAAHAILQLPDHLITIPLLLVTMLVMIANALVIAQAEMKWILNAFYVSGGVSLLVLMFSWIYLLA